MLWFTCIESLSNDTNFSHVFTLECSFGNNAY